MLKQIIIDNFIFIEKASIEFDKGFNVITGETGAGKSLFLNALNITLGNKVSNRLIQVNKDFLQVTAVFDIKNNQKLQQKLNRFGISLTDHLLTVKREVPRHGKSKCYLNGVYVSVENLRKITLSLIDIHSQHQNQTLLNPKNHLSFYDQILNLEKEKQDYFNEYQIYLKLKTEISLFADKKNKLQDEKNFIQFTVSEIENKLLSEENYQQLKNKIDLLERHADTDEIFKEILTKIEINVLPNIQIIVDKLSLLNSRLELSTIENYCDKMHSFNENLLEIKDFFLSQIEEENTSPAKIDEYQQKLADAEFLRKKYGLTLQKLADKLNEEKNKLMFLENLSFSEKDLLQKFQNQKEKILALAQKLHAKRVSNKQKVTRLINDKIHFLGMKTAEISIDFNDEQKLSPQGLGAAVFVYRSAPEVPFLDLNKIASGGEISRVMLALKSILSKKFLVETIILDEIDLGIGGNIAFSLGQEMLNIVRSNKQLLVITHLPQIAKYAQKHFLIEKNIDEQVITSIKELSAEDRIKEISRMLGGKGSTEELKYARRFLEKGY